MKALFYIRNWALFTLISFILYDVLWLLVDSEDFFAAVMENRNELVGDFIFCGIFSMTSILSCRLLIHALARQSLLTRRRLMLLAIFVLTVNICLALILDYSYESVFLKNVSGDDFWGNVYIFVFIATFIALLYLNRYYIDLIILHYEQLIEYKKQSLKKQLDPHFLFNSLNVLAELTKADSNKAEDFAIKLSSVYHYVLKTIDTDVISVKEALDFVRDYVDVMRFRFGENIDIKIDDTKIPKDGYIIPMSLQVLVENAIKHNGNCQNDRVLISITINDAFVIVSNNKPQNSDNEKPMSSAGIGLKNISERYLLEIGETPSIEETTNEYIVYLPIIRR